MNLKPDRGAEQEYVDTNTGGRFFSVTQIRRMAFDSYAMVPEHYLEPARIRGQYVHRFLWKYLAARGGLTLEWPEIADYKGYEGYCTSIVNWAEKHNVLPRRLEHISCNREYGYAGQVDAQVQYGKTQILTLMDGKSGEPTVTDPMQLILYDAMEGLKSDQLLDVYFQADGSEAKEAFVDMKTKILEWAWAMSALGNLKGRKNHKVR